jgi:outer membrane protein OmpA-like peptidoglycan-associated protein
MDGGKNPDTPMLAALADAIEIDPASRGQGSRRGRFVLMGLVAVVAAALLWLGETWVMRSMLEHRTHEALRQLVARQPVLASFPLRLDFDHRDRTLVVSGIEPSQVETAPLVDTLAAAAAPYRIVDRIGIVPGLEQSAELRTGIAVMQQSLARIQASIDETRAAIAGESNSRNAQYDGLRQQYAGLGERYAKLGEQLARLGEQYAGMQSVIESPAARLDRFMTSAAVFFGDGDQFLDSAQAAQQLQELAGLLEGNDLRIRIVGYADESGTESANRLLAHKRAEQVQKHLASLGVDLSRLFLVSRSASMPITDKVGAANGGNRRVTFENVFQTEVPH